MKKKFWLILLAFAATLCLCFGLSACSFFGTIGSVDQGGNQGEQQGGEQQGGGQDGGQGDDGHVHHFEYVYNNDATCTADGTETEHCDSCEATGETRVKAGTKLGHEMQEVQASEATCTEDGVIHHWHCNRCELNFENEDGEIQLNTVSEKKLGHEMVQIPAKTATCSECGYAAYDACSRCGFSENPVKYTNALHVQYALSNGCYCVTGLYSACNDTKIVIPNTYKGLSVTEIGSNAFRSCTSLESITIPESVTEIGSNAFSGCSSLTSITIPESVTEIGSSAFYGCSSLNAVYITDLGAWCEIDFAYSYSSFPSFSNPLIYAHHLYLDGQEVTELHIPDGIMEIKSYAFSGYSSLENIVIPASVTSIGVGSFYYCDSLETMTFKGDSKLTSIGYRAFWDCYSLTSITIPANVASIGHGAFWKCSSLESITFEGDSKLTSIGEQAFEGCSSLTSITIPASVTSIGVSAFSDCSSLNAVHITDLAAWCGIDFSNVSANPLTYAHHLYVDGWEVTELHVLDDIMKINSYAFSGCSSLEIVTIPEGVTSIGREAFSGCSSLEIVTIPEGVTSIGREVFSGCSSLEIVTIPEGVTSIGREVFSGCSSLEIVTIPESVTSIGESAFV